MTFGGSLINNGSFTTGTALQTFNGANATITNSGTFNSTGGQITMSGTNQQIFCGPANGFTIPTLTATAVTNNCSGLTISTSLAGTLLTQGPGSILNIGGTSGITTLTATATGNTVNYSAAANQTVKATTYANLTLSGTGTKTTTGVTVNGVLSMEGTATASAAPTYGANASLQYNTATARTAGVEWRTPFTGTGGVIIANTGAITMNAAKILNANVPLTINSGATLNQAGLTLTVGGAYTNNGTQSGTGTTTLNGSGATISGTGSISSTGTVTITGNKTVNAGSNIAFAGTVALSANTNVTNNGTVSVSSATGMTGANATTSVWTNAANSTLNVAGPLLTTGVLTATATGNTVNYSGAGNQTVNATTYSNLILSGSGNKTLGSGTSVTGNLSIAPSGTATASISDGLKVNIGTLTLGGVTMGDGTYGSLVSAAINRDNTYFDSARSGYVVLYGAPVFTSPAGAAFTFGTAATFAVTTDANPPVTTITKTGILPTGITFKDNGNGTATISGTPNSSGTFNLVLTATNTPKSTNQNFTLTVTPRNVNTTSAVDTDLSVSPSRHLFGVVAIGSCGPAITFTVKNTGTTPRTLGSLSFSGNDANQYQFGTVNTCSASTLAAGASCTVEVSFCPISTGSKGANLLIPSNDPETPTLAAILYNYESLEEEAARRLPPVLQNLNIPSSCMTAGQPCTISWSLLGYDDDYLSRIQIFSCVGITNGTCGNTAATILSDSGNMSADSSVIGGAGAWSYTDGGTVYSSLFNYSYTFTTPATGPVVIRFYRRSSDEDAAGLPSLSLMIPGNQNQSGVSYYDNQGRKLQYTIQ